MSSIADMKRVWALEERALQTDARLQEIEVQLSRLAALYAELEVRLDTPPRLAQQSQRR